MIVEIANAGVISDAPSLTAVAYRALQFVLSVCATIAIIGIVISGILYITSSGNDRLAEAGKKALQYSVTGLVVALGSLIIVKTLAEFLVK
jgi:hypothetical protein